MIVQCEHCHTRYRIPDEKVKGKIARVRCNKCDNTFTIRPESDRPGANQLGTAPPASETTPSVQKHPEPSRSEPDTRSAGETGFPPVTPAQPGTSPTADHQAETASEPAGSHGPGSGSEGTEANGLHEFLLKDHGPKPSNEDINGVGSQRPAHEIDKNLQGPAAESEVPGPDEEGLNLEPSSSEDKSEQPQLQPAITREAPSDMTPPADDDIGWGNIPLDTAPDKQMDEEGIGLAKESGYQPPPPPPPIFDEEMKSTRPRKGTITDKTPTTPQTPETVKPKKARKGLVLLLILAALGAGGYFAYPKVTEIINSQKEQSLGTLIPDKIQVRSLSREDGNFIYTVRGVVRNDSSGTVGMIQVEAQFRNTTGTVVAKSAAYCGNVFEDSEIVTGDLGKILVDLQNELGQSLSNSGVQPGQVIPFLIVLENPPPDVNKVTVTISGFKETT